MRLLLLLLFPLSAFSHEMTPTYFKFERSHLDGVYKTQVKLFNKRKDVEFYELGGLIVTGKQQ